MADLFSQNRPLSVSGLTRQIEAAVKKALPGRASVRGEVSNLSRPGSGHLYFTLKDDAAELKCVMFRSAAAAIKFSPTNGQEVVATGTVGVYANRGQYQLQTTALEPVGEGALELARRQLQEKLASEGLFEPGRKLAVPPYPRRIVIVSSPTAAGYEDVLKVLRAYPFLQTFLLPVPVQGGRAAPAVAEALARLTPYAGRIDAVLLCRGGGSAEDLWAFNEEAVVRAVAACGVPIVTGIGHQTDVSLCDLAADHHAHTPTAAAEHLVRRWATAADEVDLAKSRLNVALRRRRDAARGELREVGRHELFRRPTDLVDRRRQRVDDAAARLVNSLREAATRAERRLAAASRRLVAVSPRHDLRLARQRLAGVAANLGTALRRSSRAGQDTLARQRQRLAAARPDRQLADRRRQLAALAADLDAAMAIRREQRAAELARLADRLHRLGPLRAADARQRLRLARAQLRVLNPTAVLGRGFTLTRLPDGRLLRTPADAPPGTRLTTRTAGGEVTSVADEA